MTTACALFRAANIFILDYPFRAAIQSALSLCDEAVVVAGPSRDQTLPVLLGLQRELGPRLKIVVANWEYDRTWQEKVWNIGAAETGAEWLMYFDLDECLHESAIPLLRSVMDDPDIHLVRFPYLHFYGTPGWVESKTFYQHNTRLGRRDTVNFRMENWCSDDNPRHAVCQMVATIGGKDVDAHGWNGPETATVSAFMYHYGWVRDPLALALSQARHHAWYANKGDTGDGYVPEVEPYDFQMADLRAAGRIRPYHGPHPALMADWLEAHEVLWQDNSA